MNRGRCTVVGVQADGTVLARDRHGGLAHLPTECLAQHAALGYAATVHAAPKGSAWTPPTEKM